MGFVERVTAWLNGQDGWAPNRAKVGPAANECCLLPSNLALIERKPHVRVYRCQRCQRRHFRALVNENTVAGFEAGKVRIK